MIDLSEWRCKRGDILDETSTKVVYAVAYRSAASEIDERSDWASQYIRRVAASVKEVDFEYEQATLRVGDEAIEINEIDNISPDEGRVLIDATTLAFPEILYLFRILSRLGNGFDVLYVQPDDYQPKGNAKLGYTKGYMLSDDGPGPRLLPRYVYPTEEGVVSIALGFEGHRIGYIFQSEEFSYGALVGLIGIPAFKCGWENRTLTNNADSIRIAKETLPSHFKCAGANDPVEIYNQLVKASVFAGDRLLHVAPFGTKPAAVAMAWFVINNPNTGVIYDFVKKKQKRSKGTDLVHLWRFTVTAKPTPHYKPGLGACNL